MAEKMLRKERIAIQKLEERVLFDAAGVAEIIEAAEAADALQNPDVQESEAQSEDDASADVVVPPEALVQDHAAAEQGGSAEDVVADALGDAGVGVPFADLTDAAEEPVQVKELVVISSEVPDQAQIASQIAENTDVLLLDKGGNPLDVINQFLDAQENVRYETIHVVSHGDAGCFLLDGKVVNAEAVAEDPASWKAIGEHLTEDGDIMIYGCNVAGNEDGKAMISAISELTGADVAASSDAVGAFDPVLKDG